jgi:GNAT superfamily N-acetyltransferase
VITVRELRDDEIDLYIEVRNRVHPENPMPRQVVVEDRKGESHIDLLAERDGEAVGVASASNFGGTPDGDLAYVTLRVPRENRRQGVGTALHLRASEHAESLGKSRFYCVVRADDADSLAYYTARGYAEAGRMQDVFLELAAVEVEPAAPEGIEIAPLTSERERGAYEVALEADADIPTGEQHSSGTFEQWRERNLRPFVRRDLSFVALEGGRVVGYALVHQHKEDTGEHAMTGVARAARGRGVAFALKQAQVAAAKETGLTWLRTQNDLGNAPMRRVNEKLGYVKRFEWVHLTGPLLRR